LFSIAVPREFAISALVASRNSSITTRSPSWAF